MGLSIIISLLELSKKKGKKGKKKNKTKLCLFIRFELNCYKARFNLSNLCHRSFFSFGGYCSLKMGGFFVIFSCARTSRGEEPPRGIQSGSKFGVQSAHRGWERELKGE